MSRSTSLPLIPARVTERFTVQGGTRLSAGILPVPIDELHQLLSRGSGYVVWNGKRPKAWFQAQCAHYGLPTDGTLATLRRHLEKFLGPFQERTREKTEQVEKESLTERKSRRPAETTRSPAIRGRHSEPISLQKCAIPAATPQSQPEIPASKTFKKPILLRTSLPIMNSAIKPWHRNSELKAFERVELSMKFGPEPDSSGIDTESEGDSSFSVSESGVIFPPPGLPSPLFRSEPPLLQDLQLKEDVVSGRWNLCITRNAMTPLPPPWHPMSSKWLRGDMDVHLSQDTRSITAEFALLGMDGVIKSRQFEMCGEGVCVWVRFVAQMPITTAKKTGDVSQEDNRLFEPSELNCGCLTFYEKGRVTGVLECERYGSFEFEGVRIGQPRPLIAEWSDFE